MAAGGRSTGSWAVLALALAVPGLLFYTWWSKMDAAKKKELNQKIRNRGVSAFATTGRNKEKLENPIAGAPSAADAPPSAEPAPADSALPEAAPAAAPIEASLAQPAAGTEPFQGAAGLAQPGGPGQITSDNNPIPVGEVAPSSLTAQYFLLAAQMPKRDPTVSPYDEIRLQRKALEEALRRKELEEALRPPKEKKFVKREEPMPNIDLQGIISTPGGDFQAIVNDNLQREGDMIAGQVKILKISASTVVFGWKNKKFTRSVNQ